MIFVLDFNPDPALIHDRLKAEEMARLGRFERPTSGSGGGISGIGSSVLSSLDMSQSASTVLFGHVWVRLCKGLCKEGVDMKELRNCDAPPCGELVYLAFTKPWRSEGASAARKPGRNRCAKTSFLHKRRCLRKFLGESLRWVLPPTGRIPSFEGWHRGLVSGSVAGQPTSLPLLIQEKYTTSLLLAQLEFQKPVDAACHFQLLKRPLQQNATHR